MVRVMNEKLFAMLSIFVLLFTQTVPLATAFAQGLEVIEPTDSAYELKVAETTDTYNTLEVKQKVEADIISLEMKLPEEVTYEELLDGDTIKEDMEVKYNKKENTLTLTAEKALIKDFKVKVAPLNKGNNEFTLKASDSNVELVNEKHVITNNVKLEAKEAKEASIEVVKEEPKQADNKEDKKSLITPRVGNLNVDIDISPHKEEIESGKSAIYRLVLKTTGIKKEYTDAQVVIDLPLNEYTEFTQDLNELKIAGVTPTLDKKSKTLVYDFETLKTGQTYELAVKVGTKNGYTPDATELEAKASFKAKEQEKVQDNAKVKVKASSSLSVNKNYTGAVWEDNEWKLNVPVKADRITAWTIKVEIPKKDIGQMYLKEGSKIVVTDTLPDGLLFEESTEDGSIRQEGNKLIWEFDAPSLEEQEKNEGSLFTKTIGLMLRTDEKFRRQTTKKFSTCKSDIY